MTGPRARAALIALLLGAALLPSPAAAASGWWQPAAFAGMPVSDCATGPSGVVVQLGDGRVEASRDGTHFSASAADPHPGAAAGASGDRWQLRQGRVWHLLGGGVAEQDAAAPPVDPASHLIAAPGALPGVVLVVAPDGTVWRRDSSGAWARALVLQPSTLLTGTPRITAIAAFDEPLSTAVYLGTDGYGTLLTSNGGDDWLRADPGLPAHVTCLAADAATQAVYAGTPQGLFVHRLQALPSVPSYPPPDLRLRQLVTALVTLLATVAAAGALWLWVGRRAIV